MKNDLLFATLSLVSGFSKVRERDNGTLKGMEIEKNNTFQIRGVYTNVNDFWGINVQNTGTEDYFYTFDLEDEGKIYAHGEKKKSEDIKEGDILRVTYDGSVSLVYPPKLNNVSKIEILDKEEKK